MPASPHRLPPPDLPTTLGESDLSFRAILDASLDAFILFDAAGVIRMWNNRAETMFGWLEAEAIGQRLSQTIIPERYRERHEQGLARYQATGEGGLVNRRVEITARHRYGREFLVELAIAPIELADGTESFFGAFLRDISQRRETEDRLEFQATILGNVRDSIVVTDPVGLVRFWNQGAEAVFGYSAEEMLGQSILRLYPDSEEDRPRFEKDLARVLHGADSA
ncbi:MAG TPA: PAS domain S-box protein, partial [Gemmatimonadales bacterium]|nr:PAS domain S-box protein [Gemmatimonadales bacterium]